ncbi:MAG TPA: DUF2269 family protein [Gaiellaceae bacterium]|nr:DUF2269 family protein [Gaiellaceae bacterium]
MSRYELLLFVHVLAAAAWFGAALLALVLVELAARADDTGTVLKLGEYEDRLAAVLFIPAALLVLLAGFALVFDGPWSFAEDGWVGAGLAVLVATFVLGLGLIVPAGNKMKRLAAERAPAEDLRRQIRRYRLLSWIDVGLLAVAIFLMTAKPF